MEILKMWLFVIGIFVVTGLVPVIVSFIPMWVEAGFLFGVCGWLFWYAIRPERRR